MQRSKSQLTRRAFVHAGAALGAGLALGTRGLAQTRPALRLDIFGGVDAWPIYVIVEKQLLPGYDVQVTTTGGSVPQIKAMQSGEAEVALTAMDNLIAYDEGQGDPSVPGPFDLVAFLGIGPGELRLVARPEIASYAQLRGATLAVDAPNTGFSFVLRRVLERNGIAPGQYTFLPVGSTQKRFEAMVAKKAVAALVSTPFDKLGEEQDGFRVLADPLTTLGHYQATVLMARRSWIATNRPAVAALVQAYRAATAWLYDPKNRAEAMAILARSAKLAPELVAQITPGLLDVPGTFSRTGQFDPAGIDTVLSLRSSYATPPKALQPRTAYIDTTFL